MSGQGVTPCREVTVTGVRRLAFGVYSDDEVRDRIASAPLLRKNRKHFLQTTEIMVQMRRLSVKRITNPVTLDSSGNVLPDGLYDAALGLQAGWIASRECITCRLNQSSCPGHFGHIELPVPVYNPLLFKCDPLALLDRAHMFL